MSARADFVDPLDLVDAERYGKRGYPHDVWTRLRAEAPLARLEAPGFEPFWAVTKHADVQHIAKDPLRFSSAGGITLRRAGAPLPPPTEILVLQDPPRHGPMRRIANPDFTPRGVKARRPDIERIAVEVLGEALHEGAPGELDFVGRIAGPFPLAVIASVLGAPLTEAQVLSYAELLVEAGNETTRNAISGGVLALAERPGEWDKLRANPEVLPDAVEEILRWASPISHFTRIATEDAEVVRGVTIPAGDQVALYFASANRDEDVFEDPFAFRVDRRPNPHLAFGFGEHFCMGAHLARVEIEVMFRHLVERVDSFEVAGPVERLSSIVNGSIKRLPIRLHHA